MRSPSVDFKEFHDATMSKWKTNTDKLKKAIQRGSRLFGSGFEMPSLTTASRIAMDSSVTIARLGIDAFGVQSSIAKNCRNFVGFQAVCGQLSLRSNNEIAIIPATIRFPLAIFLLRSANDVACQLAANSRQRRDRSFPQQPPSSSRNS